MAVAEVPIPAGTPDRTEVRLRRLSGRPVPMYADTGKTVGPIYATLLDPDVALYADEGVYELALRDPAGNTSATQVQVGTGAVVTPVDAGSVTYEELEQILAAERALNASRYADVASPEVVTAPWRFDVLPTDADGIPLGAGTGTGTGYLPLTYAEFLELLDARYFRPDAPTTVSGVVDFSAPPTINGEVVTAGSDPALYSQVQAAVAEARAARLAAEAAQAAAEAAAGIDSGVTYEARVRGVSLEVVSTVTDPDPVNRWAFPGSPSPGVNETRKIRLGANHGQTRIQDFDLAIYPPASGTMPTARCSVVREYSQENLDFEPSMRSLMRTWCTEGRVPMVSVKCDLGRDPALADANNPNGKPTNATKLAELEAIAAGQRDAQLASMYEFVASLPGPVWWSPLWHEPEDDYTTDELCDAFRRATRRIITRGNAVGTALTSKVAWAGVHYIGSTFFARSGVDWKQYHANWSSGPGVQGWEYDLLHLDALDRYNPGVTPTTTQRNRTWAQDAALFLDKRRADGGIELPWIIGEHGLYTDQGNPYDNNGVTVEQILLDMVNNGPGVHGLAGCAMWNNARASIKTEETDPGFVKRAALRLAAVRPNVVRLPAPV